MRKEKDLIKHIKDCKKEFEMLYKKIETNEDYILFLSYLKAIAISNDIKQSSYWKWIADVILDFTKRSNFLNTIMNKK